MSGRVAVIGAGSSGITCVKCFLDAGFKDIVCYERRDVMGGLWYYSEKVAQWEDESSVNRSTIINTSKEFMPFSDYPMPDHYPNFCHNTDVHTYFQDYAKHFGVNKYILYNTEVILLKKHSSYNSTGRWEIKLRDHKSNSEKVEVFDFVMVANGHHGAPNLPTFPGLDIFKGKTMHSKEFKDVRSAEGKKAVVIGIGNSGGDICVELSKYTKVFLATRRGAWIMNRLTADGLPWDVFYHTRIRKFLNSIIPRSYRNSMLKKVLNERFDHDLYHMTPLCEPDATHPTVNDELPNRIAAGMVKVKPNVSKFTETGVVFEDGTFEDNIDVVIFATGYKVEYPFIDKSVLDIKNNKVDMYKNMFLPDLPKQTIAFLGVCQPLGSLFPIAEMESRVAASVFKGETKLPSPEVMRKEIDAEFAKVRSRYVGSQRHTIQRDWLPFMDELASMIGCKPNLLVTSLSSGGGGCYELGYYFFTDPSLFKCLLFGPGAPFQYRLKGPNPWPGARNAMFTVMDRVNKPFDTRPLPVRSKQSFPWFKAFFITSLVAGSSAFAAYYIKENNIDLSQYFKFN